jgi:hypothetical protein
MGPQQGFAFTGRSEKTERAISEGGQREAEAKSSAPDNEGFDRRMAAVGLKVAVVHLGLNLADAFSITFRTGMFQLSSLRLTMAMTPLSHHQSLDHASMAFSTAL